MINLLFIVVFFGAIIGIILYDILKDRKCERCQKNMKVKSYNGVYVHLKCPNCSFEKKSYLIFSDET